MAVYFEKCFAEIEPELHFASGRFNDFNKWKKKLKTKLLELLGEFPESVSLNPEFVAEADCGRYLRRKIVYDVEKHFSIPAWLLVPKGIKAKEQRPAVLALHGHGQFGKDSAAGVVGEIDERQAEINRHNYNYGQFLAEAGFVVLVPDSRVFGELRDGTDPFPGRDPCNVNFNKGLYIGKILLTLNIWDMMKGIDFLQTLDFVDKSRIGACGLSWGGTRTAYITVLDERIKASVIMGYMPKTSGYALDANTCGSQFVPGIYRYADVPDIIGLIAPKPLQLQAGIDDACFSIYQQRACIDEVASIYKAAGAKDKLDIDIFSGAHQCHRERLISFFNRCLKG
ncbi:MAG: hypothetical protein HYY56_01325 [Candidatus Omnitrophica bacterium]|nr:hypothetical protein [Candidatus Omnitrophota bacterium]